MHLSTIVSSFVLAAVVVASPAPLTSVDSAGRLAVRSPLEQSTQAVKGKLAAKCFSGCGSGIQPIGPNFNFAQGPGVFSQQGQFSSFSSFTSSMSGFATACQSTVTMWQSYTSIQTSIQTVLQQFRYMIVSMSTLLAPFQSVCHICERSQGIAYSQTVVQVIVQVHSVVSFIYQQYGSQLVYFRQEFQAVSLLFQTIIGLGSSMGVDMHQIFISNQFNFQTFNACGIPTNTWFQTTNYLAPTHVGLLAQVLGPIIQAIQPVVDGVEDVVEGLGDGVSKLLSQLL